MKYIIEIPKALENHIDSMYSSYRTSDVFHHVPDHLSDTFITAFDCAVDCAMDHIVNCRGTYDDYDTLATAVEMEIDSLFTVVFDSIGRLRINRLIDTFVDYISENDDADHRFPIAVCSYYESAASRTDSRLQRKENILNALKVALTYEIVSRFKDEDLLSRLRSSLRLVYDLSTAHHSIRLNHDRRTLLLEAS